MDFTHIPVLLRESIDGLKIKPDGIYVDGTIGGAGHSLEISKTLSKKGLLIGIDRDEEALTAAKIKLKAFENIIYIHGNHDDVKDLLKKQEIEKVDGILLDLGVSSYQLDEAQRGFSYMKDAVLDMRMDKTALVTAKNVINSYKEEELSKIFFEYGEEKFSKKIAKQICKDREIKPIETTKELVQIIEKVIPRFNKNQGHPAKRIFQAIRIEVNNELKPLENTVKDCIDLLKPGGRLCIITFHSLEDKIVKKAYIDAEGKCTCPKDLPYCVCGNVSLGKIITKKAIVATEEELKNNSRAKSAKLRIFEKK